jgi:hypothetical protein
MDGIVSENEIVLVGAAEPTTNSASLTALNLIGSLDE